MALTQIEPYMSNSSATLTLANVTVTGTIAANTLTANSLPVATVNKAVALSIVFGGY
jgi:hypothetical protein